MAYRIGYSFFGFLGDNKIKDGKEISAPCGNATYSYSIIYELLNRGCEVWQMMPDRDEEAYKLYGSDNFKAFSKEKRNIVYAGTNKFKVNKLVEYSYLNSTKYPELDILLVEWRFPIEGRNCFNSFAELEDIVNGKMQPDLFIQDTMLAYYKEKTNTKIIFFDLDHKLTYSDEKYFVPDAIFETADYPNNQYIHRDKVNIPCMLDDLIELKPKELNEDKELVYIGSRYERDDVIDEYIKPYAERRPGKVHFYGNWKDYPEKYEEAKLRWPGVVFNNRVTTKDFYDIYSDAIAVPLLGKKSYFKSGFVTARVFESIMFGSVPIGFQAQEKIWSHVRSVAQTWKGLMHEVDLLKNPTYRKITRDHQLQWLQPHDVKYFVDKIEEVLNR